MDKLGLHQSFLLGGRNISVAGRACLLLYNLRLLWREIVVGGPSPKCGSFKLCGFWLFCNCRWFYGKEVSEGLPLDEVLLPLFLSALK